MNMTRRTVRKHCPNCPTVLEVLDHVLRQIQTEATSPRTIAALDAGEREFLHSLQLQLSRARRLAAEAA